VSFERKKIVTSSNTKRRKPVTKKTVKAKRKSLQKRRGSAGACSHSMRGSKILGKLRYRSDWSCESCNKLWYLKKHKSRMNIYYHSTAH